MHMLPLMFITLLSAQLLIGCSSTPETKGPLDNHTGVQTKGQMFSKCLDGNSIEYCDERYNP